MNTAVKSIQSAKQKESAIFNWKLNKGIISLSYVGSQAIFTEQTYFGSVVSSKATTKDCDCQMARNGYVCQHINYLRENVEF